MKNANNILFALAAALLMVGCAKVEPDFGNKQAEDLDITFQVGNYAAATKATEELGTDVRFGAFSTFTPGAYEDGSATPYMQNVEVYNHQDGTSSWRSDVSYYWPKAGKLSFVSYAPYSNSINTSIVDGHKIRFNEYTVGSDDLMYSDPVVNQTANSKDYYKNGFNGVPTLFHHALSLVSFEFKYEKPEDASIVLNSASISNVAQTGSYTGGEEIWTPKSGAETTEYDIKAKAGNYFYVMPQNLDNVLLNINASMEFTLQATDGSDVTVKTPIVVSVPLKTADLERWESNKQIHYTVTISGEAALIKFSGKVNEWQNGTSKDILI